MIKKAHAAGKNRRRGLSVYMIIGTTIPKGAPF